MLIVPDFSEAAESKPVPPGTYSARIKAVEPKESQAGNKYLSWKLELFGSPEVNNRIVFHRTMISGPGAFRLRDLYAAATGKKIADKESFDTMDLIGKELKVMLVEQKDQEGNVSQFPEVKAVARLQ